jgi:hypothetical protein
LPRKRNESKTRYLEFPKKKHLPPRLKALVGKAPGGAAVAISLETSFENGLKQPEHGGSGKKPWPGPQESRKPLRESAKMVQNECQKKQGSPSYSNKNHQPPLFLPTAGHLSNNTQGSSLGT